MKPFLMASRMAISFNTTQKKKTMKNLNTVGSSRQPKGLIMFTSYRVTGILDLI